MSPLDQRKSLPSVNQNHITHYIVKCGHISYEYKHKVGKCGIISVFHNVIHTTRALKCKPSAIDLFQGSCLSYVVSSKPSMLHRFLSRFSMEKIN